MVLINLHWTTSTELNADHFIVEKNEDGNHWDAVTSISASGVVSDYHFKDSFAGPAYYRLKEIDKDGQSKYSSIIRSNCEIKNVSVLVYPNPVHDYTNLVFNSPADMKATILVHDATGRLIKRIAAGVQRGNNMIRVGLLGLAPAPIGLQ